MVSINQNNSFLIGFSSTSVTAEDKLSSIGVIASLVQSKFVPSKKQHIHPEKVTLEDVLSLKQGGEWLLQKNPSLVSKTSPVAIFTEGRKKELGSLLQNYKRSLFVETSNYASISSHQWLWPLNSAISRHPLAPALHREQFLVLQKALGSKAKVPLQGSSLSSPSFTEPFIKISPVPFVPVLKREISPSEAQVSVSNPIPTSKTKSSLPPQIAAPKAVANVAPIQLDPALVSQIASEMEFDPRITEKPVFRNDPKNQFVIALSIEMYSSIHGTTNESAISWYKKAAAGGVMEAYFRLGLLYEQRNDKGQAREFFIKAAKNGCYEAQIKCKFFV